MAVSNELTFPETEELFEEMCFHLFRMDWKDPGCVRLGSTGQGQFGLDIIGTHGIRKIGVQCKHYVKTPFTLSTVKSDIEKADIAGIDVDHLIFATTAASKTDLVLKVRTLSEERRSAGKFTVSVAFWQELSGMLRLNKEVAREYIPNFPGGNILQIVETTETTLALVKSSTERDLEFQAEVRSRLPGNLERGTSPASASNLPQSQGTEADPVIAKSLDLVRSKVLEGRPKDAFLLLDSLGNPDRFHDTYSRFRWHTNRAAALLLEGKKPEAAREYLVGAAVDPRLEKAWCNRAHAHLLLDDFVASLAASSDGLKAYPESGPLWALNVAAKHAAGDTEPERDVPKHILDASDLRFTLSHVRYKQGRLEESLDMIALCIEGEAPSLETRRSYLAASLTWATSDPEGAHHDQITPKQRTALVDALRLLEPLEATLSGIQVGGISEELAGNVCVALLLVGNRTRARAIAAVSLERHPVLESALRIRVDELASIGNIVELRKLTDKRYEELPTTTLAALAEVSANEGDLVWYREVREVLDGRKHSEHQLSELRALDVHAYWEAGEEAKALVCANELLATYPEHVLTRVLMARMLLRKGDFLGVAKHAGLAEAALKPESTVGEVLHVADLQFDRTLYPEAASLYGRVAGQLGNNGLTRRYLASLIESGQRRKASEALDSLTLEVRSSPDFCRIESNLARRMGDWPRMRDVLKAELDRIPTDSGVAVGYIGALHRIPGEKETLRAYLASDPIYDGKRPLDEVEVAKYQREYGLASLALRRVYRQFRAHPNDATIGGYFLMQVLLGSSTPELSVVPTSITAGTVVHLRAETETRDIAIDFDDVVDAASWPELVSPKSDIARDFLGKKLGDSVHLSRGIGTLVYEVVGLSPLYVFAMGKVNKLLSDTASPGGPMWSVNLEKKDGSLDVEPLLAMSRQKSARIREALNNYEVLRFPLATLAQLVGTEPLLLMLDWPSSKASLFVSLGTQEERQAALSLLETGGRSFVIDLPTLGELVGTGVFRAIAPLLGKSLIPESAREELTNAIQYQETVPSSMSIREEDGQYFREEATQEQLDSRLTFLREMLACMDELCEVTPVLGPSDVTDSHRTVANLLDNATLDAVYLSLERNAVLLSDDGGLRLTAPAVGLVETMAVQPLLMHALARGTLDLNTYVDVVIGKVLRAHDFISVRTEDLLTLVRRDTNNVATGVLAVLETLKSQTLELHSGVQVCREFLTSIVSLCPPLVVKEYFAVGLSALQHGRMETADAIHRALVEAVEQGIKELKRKPASAFRRQLGALLVPPAAASRRIQLSPLAQAVRELIRIISHDERL